MLCLLWAAAIAGASAAASSKFPCSSVEECLKTPLWHIPGPNPIVAPAAQGWSATECEVAGGVFQIDKEHLGLYYHCLSPETDNNYRVGVSTASNPLGPWSPPNIPILNATPGGWDSASVASFNILRDPRSEKSGQWLGWYEGGHGGPWTLGLATAPDPSGPWTKFAGNPILNGSAVCDPSRTFDKKTCNGLYVASMLHDPVYTHGEYWMYMEAPINQNDEGAIALWTADRPEGPFKFKAYVLDGGFGNSTGRWDAGRYSESRVWHHNGLFHLFASGSPTGNPEPNKINEQIGWAISSDGIHFTESLWNPVAAFSQSTPHTQAMAEAHVWFDDDAQLIYVYHTLRWDAQQDAFAPDGRNAEDLAVEVLSPSASFELDMPLITPNWRLNLKAGDESPCKYDWKAYRYCVPIKARIGTSSPQPYIAALSPKLTFKVAGRCGKKKKTVARVSVHIYSFGTNGVGSLIDTLEADGHDNCDESSTFLGSTSAKSFGHADEWIVATFSTTVPLNDVDMTVHFSSKVSEDVITV